MLRFSRPTSDNTDNLWPPYCVLPQVALWGKGILCLLVAIFTSLSLFFCVASFSFSSISFFEGGCGFEGLNESPEVWADTIINVVNANLSKRRSYAEEVKKNGFDSHSEAIRMMKFYLNKL